MMPYDDRSGFPDAPGIAIVFAWMRSSFSSSSDGFVCIRRLYCVGRIRRRGGSAGGHPMHRGDFKRGTASAFDGPVHVALIFEAGVLTGKEDAFVPLGQPAAQIR